MAPVHKWITNGLVGEMLQNCDAAFQDVVWQAGFKLDFWL